MDLIFDTNAKAILSAIGYKYFCTREEWTPVQNEEDDVIYWELMPFTSQYEAFEYYFNCQKIGLKCFIFVDDEMVDELSDGMPGLVIRIKEAEHVLC